MRATCYQFRNSKGIKTVGGSLGMSQPLDMNEGAARVVAMLKIAVSNTGRAYFTRNNEEVFAYLTIDASETEAGKAAVREWNAQREREAVYNNVCPCCNQSID